MEDIFFKALANNGFPALIAGYLVYAINRNFGRLIDWLSTWQVKINMAVSVKQKEGGD